MAKSENNQNLKLLGIDIGSKIHGLALWNPKSKLIRPLEPYIKKTLAQDLKFYRILIENEKVEAIVLGYPTKPSGEHSLSTKNTLFWKEQLESEFGLKVFLQDEAQTSLEAVERLEGAGLKKQQVDSVAAAIILERFLEKETFKS